MKFFEKQNIDTKLFLILWIGCMIGYICAVPYGLELQKEALAQVSTPIYIIVLSQLATTIVVYFFLIFIGLKLIQKTPYKFAIINNKKKQDTTKNIFLSIFIGFIIFASIGLVGFLLDLFLGKMETTEIFTQPSIWKGFFASFYGAINEEILLRLVVMTITTYFLMKVKWFRKKFFQPYIIWFSIIVAALVFGLGHIPTVIGMGESINVELILRIILPNAVAGVTLGYVYWKKGFEYAVIAHFTADVFLHSVLPLFI